MEKDNEEECEVYVEYGQKDIKDIITELLEKYLEIKQIGGEK